MTRGHFLFSPCGAASVVVVLKGLSLLRQLHEQAFSMTLFHSEDGSILLDAPASIRIYLAIILMT